ncbi:MAG TPA: aromatic amino acid DMT transporter YddG [Phycisphaerae bacterium]|nr:aromatic amino acid DMT transporter YddG [Phycisphaerae bacterium]HOJ74390.1 aromatic amino acid DMT transporter YddG [Phycisphaerae bacterium]HOM52879.1 aromatic amino acid DMT transporter YddG [Phycisphaerae bacterium]HON69223.1 aromatic amino acid DMT transporter YddG [Phycisphaerae bacterium]HPP27137.1 aromatic amino acid DMT transporter YddG [Phycisphaerae bacterium]
MSRSSREQLTGTCLGIAAILIWSSLVAVARGTSEHLGVLASAALANLVGGGLAVAVAQMRTGYLEKVIRLPRNYLLGCGALFVLYNLALYPALQAAATEQQVIEVGLIQYLWPALTLALAVPVLGKNASPWLVPGLIVATAGAFLAKSGGSLSWASFRVGLDTNPWPYALALVAAMSWALYSNLARRWAGQRGVSGAPLFLTATGVALAIVHAVRGGGYHLDWQLRPVLELAYLTLFPTLLAYVFWDFAMRQGNIILVSSLSFFTPLLSTLISSIYLGVPMGVDLWIASGLVIVGAFICKRSIREPQIAPTGTDEEG